MMQPYPANLMVGFYARADATQPIRTDLDNELVGMRPVPGYRCCPLITIDARWYTRAEIQAVLDHPTGTKFGSAEYNKMAESTEGRNTQHGSMTTEEIQIEGPLFKLPPIATIAGVLIRDWAEGKIGFPPDSGLVKQPLYMYKALL